MNISLEAYEVLKQEYQRQASHYTEAFTPFDGLFEVVGMVLNEIKCCNLIHQRVCNDEYLTLCEYAYCNPILSQLSND